MRTQLLINPTLTIGVRYRDAPEHEASVDLHASDSELTRALDMLASGEACQVLLQLRSVKLGRRGILLGSGRTGAGPETAIGALTSAVEAGGYREGTLDALPVEEVERLAKLDVLITPQQLAEVVPEVASVDIGNPLFAEQGGIPEHAVFFSVEESALVDNTECIALDESPYADVVPELGLEAGTQVIATPISRFHVPVRPALGSDLRAQGLRMPADEAERSREYFAAAQESLERDGYAVLRSIFTPAFSSALQEYTRQLASRGYLFHGDDDINRHWLDGEPVMQAIHHNLAPVISNVVSPTSGACKPSFCYYSQYMRGASLPRHKDREQCRWNLSVMFNTEPFVEREQQWPIYLAIGEEVREVKLGLGDGVLYSGATYEHWREPLQEAESAALCFFMFVDEDFAGQLG